MRSLGIPPSSAGREEAAAAAATPAVPALPLEKRSSFPVLYVAAYALAVRDMLTGIARAAPLPPALDLALAPLAPLARASAPQWPLSAEDAARLGKYDVMQQLQRWVRDPAAAGPAGSAEPYDMVQSLLRGLGPEHLAAGDKDRDFVHAVLRGIAAVEDPTGSRSKYDMASSLLEWAATVSPASGKYDVVQGVFEWARAPAAPGRPALERYDMLGQLLALARAADTDKVGPRSSVPPCLLEPDAHPLSSGKAASQRWDMVGELLAWAKRPGQPEQGGKYDLLQSVMKGLRSSEPPTKKRRDRGVLGSRQMPASVGGAC